MPCSICSNSVRTPFNFLSRVQTYNDISTCTSCMPIHDALPVLAVLPYHSLHARKRIDGRREFGWPHQRGRIAVPLHQLSQLSSHTLPLPTQGRSCCFNQTDTHRTSSAFPHTSQEEITGLNQCLHRVHTPDSPSSFNDEWLHELIRLSRITAQIVSLLHFLGERET